ncbi:MAG: hypothetical protein IKJ99_06105 [Oscillospiraceae bacterium]|nr:hypothetical protein [Oscillospiraceae bacterium]
MKKMFSRITAFVLMCAIFVSCCVPAVSAAGYSCSDYSQCTENGGEVYMITKPNCAIRKEAHNKGEIVARGQVGDLISVNRVFWTPKLTRWCEINVIGSNEKLYIYIENCEPHTVHHYISLLSTDNGYVDFCAVCGVAVAVAEGEVAGCDLTCVADQAVKGSFSDYNPTFTSVVAQIVAGEIPGVGTVADARDLIGDIMNGEEAWVIAADMVAFLPLIGALKYSDEIAILAKNSDEIGAGLKHSDNFGSGFKYTNEVTNAAKKADGIFWGKWSDYEKVTINGKEYAKIGDFNYTEHAVSEFLNPSIETNQILRIDPVTGKRSYVEHSRGIPTGFVNFVLTEGVELGTTKVSPEYVDAITGAVRRKYTSGTLEVVVEEGNIVVTIFSK